MDLDYLDHVIHSPARADGEQVVTVRKTEGVAISSKVMKTRSQEPASCVPAELVQPASYEESCSTQAGGAAAEVDPVFLHPGGRGWRMEDEMEDRGFDG